MSDLISKAQLLEKFQEFKEAFSNQDMRRECGVAEMFINIIQNTPPAYDVDKVVNVLNGEMENEAKYWKEFDDEDAFGAMHAYRAAAGIVRNGGIV